MCFSHFPLHAASGVAQRHLFEGSTKSANWSGGNSSVSGATSSSPVSCSVCEDPIDDDVHQSIFCSGQCQSYVLRGCEALSWVALVLWGALVLSTAPPAEWIICLMRFLVWSKILLIFQSLGSLQFTSTNKSGHFKGRDSHDWHAHIT